LWISNTIAFAQRVSQRLAHVSLGIALCLAVACRCLIAFGHRLALTLGVPLGPAVACRFCVELKNGHYGIVADGQCVAVAHAEWLAIAHAERLAHALSCA
jgi:hypothetical protein